MENGIRSLAALIPLILITVPGCVRVQTEPIRVEPIYIEITINHRVQQELDDFFADIDRASATMEYEPLETDESSSGKE
jgi:hypothetical protein